MSCPCRPPISVFMFRAGQLLIFKQFYLGTIHKVRTIIFGDFQIPSPPCTFLNNVLRSWLDTSLPLIAHVLYGWSFTFNVTIIIQHQNERERRLIWHQKHSLGFRGKGDLQTLFRPQMVPKYENYSNQFTHSPEFFKRAQFRRPQMLLIPQCPIEKGLSSTIEIDKYRIAQEF